MNEIMIKKNVLINKGVNEYNIEHDSFKRYFAKFIFLSWYVIWMIFYVVGV